MDFSMVPIPTNQSSTDVFERRNVFDMWTLGREWAEDMALSKGAQARKQDVVCTFISSIRLKLS